MKKAAYRFIAKFGQNIARKKGHYAEDGLISIHNNEFTLDESFVSAYQRGLDSGHGVDPNHRWRIHTALWAAQVASRLEGDFVECGVNTGFVSSAIMHHLDWNTLNKNFYLLDTFNGPVEKWFSEAEQSKGKVEESIKAKSLGRFRTDIQATIENFSEWNSVSIVQGAVPDTLPQVKTEKVAYLHLDMNQAYPEVKAAEHFWPLIVPGGVILLDDYAFIGYEAQKSAMDGFARKAGVEILSLPTGQGLIIKPPHT